ncbi:MAG: FMN-binding protein [bacterium]
MSSPAGGWVQSRAWMVLSLVLVCIVAAFGLARVYSATQPVIEQQKLDATSRALAEVLPGADRFEAQELPDTLADRFGLWYGLDVSGRQVGSVLRVAPRGYAGPIETLAGIGLDGLVTGVAITALKETPGLGLKAAGPGFLNQFTGRDLAGLKLKQDGDGPDGLDAISAATITSRAVTNGIRDGLEALADRLPRGPDQPNQTEPADITAPGQP